MLSEVRISLVHSMVAHKFIRGRQKIPLGISITHGKDIFLFFYTPYSELQVFARKLIMILPCGDEDLSTPQLILIDLDVWGE